MRPSLANDVSVPHNGDMTVSSPANVSELLSAFRRFFPFLRPHLRRVALNAFALAAATAATAALIGMVGRGFDLLHAQRFSDLPIYLFAVILIVVALQTLRYLNLYWHEWMEQRVIYALRRALYAHLLLLSTPFRQCTTSGDLLTRLAQDVSRVSQLLVLVPAFGFSYTLSFATYLTILFYIDYRLAFVALLLLPLFVWQQRHFSRRTRVSSQAFLDYQGRMSGFEAESLANLQGIASFNAQPLMLQRFDDLFGKFRRAAMRNLLLNNAFIVSFELLAALCAILLVTLGVVAIERNELTIGGLVNFLLYAGYLAVPLRGLSSLRVESQIRAAAAVRVAEILDSVPRVGDAPDARTLASVQGALRFANVDFAYVDVIPVLRGFNLRIACGEFIALVGPSGAGKSTIARLLLRFYDPAGGGIFIDDVDLRAIKLDSLRAHIGVVWQEPFLIDDTVRANLLLAKPHANDAEIVAAATKAQAHEFILQLPQGYNTVVGGDRLSTGQKQRLAIAQALLKDAPILILDEATSALDAQSEAGLRAALIEVRRDRTVLVIAHRYTTIVDADRVVYLNGDGSAAIGTFAQLNECHAPFRDALRHQGPL